MLLTAMEYLRDEDALCNFCGSQKKSEKVENDIDFETSQPSPDQENRSDTKSKEWLKRLKILGENNIDMDIDINNIDSHFFTQTIAENRILPGVVLFVGLVYFSVATVLYVQ